MMNRRLVDRDTVHARAVSWKCRALALALTTAVASFVISGCGGSSRLTDAPAATPASPTTPPTGPPSVSYTAAQQSTYLTDLADSVDATDFAGQSAPVLTADGVAACQFSRSSLDPGPEQFASANGATLGTSSYGDLVVIFSVANLDLCP